MILGTGATGLNGSELVRRVQQGVSPCTPWCTVPPGQMGSSLSKVEIVEGDMARPETLSGALQ